MGDGSTRRHGILWSQEWLRRIVYGSEPVRLLKDNQAKDEMESTACHDVVLEVDGLETGRGVLDGR